MQTFTSNFTKRFIHSKLYATKMELKGIERLARVRNVMFFHVCDSRYVW